MFVRLFLISIVFVSAHAKIYERCELLNELVEVHTLSESAAAKLTCLAEVAEFNTTRKTIEYTEEDQYGFRNYMCKYGIFRFSSEYWCSERSTGGLCNINCQKFLDDDISDDLACVIQIQKNRAVYNSWGYDWPGGHNHQCDWLKYLRECQEFKNSWKSTDDCLLRYPELPQTMWKDDGQNGVRALKHEFPHAVALGWTQRESSEIKWACGGSLITEDTILTAAHCTINHEQESPDVVRMGDLNLLTDDDIRETQQFEIGSIIRHPDYRPRYNDIALIKLKTKVNVTKFVIPACLWPTYEVPSKTSLEACGFGQTEYGGDISSVLNKVTLTYLDTSICQKSYEGIRLLKDGLEDRIHLCANDQTGKNMDTCEGDSGGPLELKLRLVDKVVPFIVGVTAFGKLCGSTESPGVYTRVSSYIDWIRQHTPNLPTTPLECAVQYRDQRFRISKSPRSFEKDENVNHNIFGDKPFATQVTGVIISDRFIFTSARKLKELSNANRVHIGQPHFIERIVYHPNFNLRNPETDDIAVVKLRQRISWTNTHFPLCITSNTFDNEKPVVEETYYDQTRNIRMYQVLGSNMTVCQQFYAKSFDFSKVDPHKILCVIPFATKHVPNSCDIPIGTPIHTSVEINGKIIMIVKGFAIFSQDCGPIIATKLSAYTDWINQEAFNGP